MAEHPYEGHIDQIDGASIRGWAWRFDRPNEPISIDLVVDGAPAGSYPAASPRADLAAAGKGKGDHAFEIWLPDRYRDGATHLVRAFFHGTGIELGESPRSIAVPPASQSDRELAERRTRLDAQVRHRSAGREAMTPKVSVIVPCFNAGQYVDEAIDSVLEQTRADFEILVVDDGSTDQRTREWIERCDRPHTQVFSRPHLGVSEARNFGIAQSRGEYLSFLDADDRLDALFLEKTIAPLDADPSLAFVSCWLRTFGGEDWIWRQERCDLSSLLAECTVATPAPVRRRVVDEVGGFDPGLGELFAEDWDLWISIVERGHRGIILPEVLFYYRRYAGSNSRRWDDPRFVARVTRALFARHETAYRDRMFEVLLQKEQRAGTFLRTNYDLQREVGRLESDLAARKSEVDRLRQRVAHADDSGSSRREERSTGNGNDAIRWGELDRLSPFSTNWGFDRGTPVDRHYIETFLRAHAEDIRGDVLEVGGGEYTRQFGGGRVRRGAVVDIAAGNPAATIVADLRDARAIPSGSFDCFVMTQTAYLIYEIEAVVAECARILRPGGVLLATLPCTIRLEPETGLDADFWRLGPGAARTLFSRAFPPAQLSVTEYGNLLTGVAFCYGLALEELGPGELDVQDPRFPLTLGIRAVAAPSPGALPQ